MSRIFILLLEDSVLDADLELAHLTRAGMEFVSRRVDTREDFVHALESERFDLILADFQLPGFNGLEALAIAREKALDTPFIFVSGMLGEEIAIDSLKNGATDYVLKMRLERLVPAVDRALAETRERTERRRVASALQETENRFRQMADSAPVMIWISGPEKSWNYCNKLWLNFTGLSREQSSGSGWTSLLYPDDLSRVLETYDSAFESHQEFTIEYRLRRHDGEYRWIVSCAVPRFDDGSNFIGFIGSCTDITDVKRTEERLRHAAKLESLGILAGGIAHDFNNLLTGIMGNATLVLEDLPPGSRVMPFVENIVQASETAAQLTRQMLAYSGKGRFVLEQVDLSKQVREILSLLEASIPKSIELKVDLARNLPRIEADAGQIQQLVMNFVINGAEAIGPDRVGCVTVSTELALVGDATSASMLSSFAVAPGKYVMLRVRDNGHGMDETTKSLIFDPFFTTKFTGRGLGLAAVSGIIRGHKAGLQLESEPEGGTEFRIYLPVSSDAPADQDFSSGRVKQGSGTILVVDDEPMVIRTARLTLQRYGYAVLSAQNGREAVDLFRAVASEIDLVLIDMTMPVMSGDLAFQEIRSIRPDVRVIATSGYDAAEAISRFGEGIHGFLQKPYKAAQLVEHVQEVLERNTAASE